MRWEIKEFDGQSLLRIYSVPGNLSRGEVARILVHLAARYLTPDEVIKANLRKGMRGKTNLLEINHNGGVMCIGENPFIVARKAEGKE